MCRWGTRWCRGLGSLNHGLALAGHVWDEEWALTVTANAVVAAGEFLRVGSKPIACHAAQFLGDVLDLQGAAKLSVRISSSPSAMNDDAHRASAMWCSSSCTIAAIFAAPSVCFARWADWCGRGGGGSGSSSCPWRGKPQLMRRMTSRSRSSERRGSGATTRCMLARSTVVWNRVVDRGLVVCGC